MLSLQFYLIETNLFIATASIAHLMSAQRVKVTFTTEEMLDLNPALIYSDKKNTFYSSKASCLFSGSSLYSYHN